MKSFKLFWIGFTMALMAFFSTGFFSSMQAQTCGTAGAGEYPFQAHGGYPCAVTITVNYTGGSITCPGVTVPYTIGIPLGTTVTSVVVNGNVAPVSPPGTPGCFAGPCTGVCGPFQMELVAHLPPGGVPEVHIN